MKKNISLLTGIAVLTTAFGMTGNAIAQVKPITLCNFAWTESISSFDEKVAPSDCIQVNPLSFSFQKTVAGSKDYDGSETMSTGDIIFFDINVTGVTGDGDFTIYDEWDTTLFQYDPINFASVQIDAPSGATLDAVIESGAPTSQLEIKVSGLQEGDTIQVPLVYIGTADGNDQADVICNTLSTIVDDTTGTKYSSLAPTPGGADILDACIDDTEIVSYTIEKYSKDAFDKDGKSLGTAAGTTLNPGNYVHYVINISGDAIASQAYDVFPDDVFDPTFDAAGTGTNPTSISPTNGTFDDNATDTPVGFDVIDYGVHDFTAGAIDVIVKIN